MRRVRAKERPVPMGGERISLLAGENSQSRWTGRTHTLIWCDLGLLCGLDDREVQNVPSAHSAGRVHHRPVRCIE